MFWIHGGAFKHGSGNTSHYGPEFLMSKNVVLVCVGCRLNIFGFFNLSNPEFNITGNQSLKDQLEALRWTQKSIANYGGDPNNVTIFGQSSGAASCQLHLFSPKSKGLFHKAILQSGTAHNAWVVREHNHDEIFEILGCTASDFKGKREFLLSQSSHDIFKAMGEINNRYLASGFCLGEDILGKFPPNLERPSAHAFIEEMPSKILARGDFYRCPIMLGYCSQEAFAFALDDNPEIREKQLYVPKDIADKEKYPKIIESIEAEIKQFYFGNESIFSPKNLINRTNFYSDIVLNYGTIQHARVHASKNSPAYFYIFDVATKINFMRNAYARHLPPEKLGVFDNVCAHCDEMSYLFTRDFIPLAYIEPGSAEERMIKLVTSLWTNFAKYADPNARNDEEKRLLNDIAWKPIDRDEMVHSGLNYLRISNEKVFIENNPDGDRMKFWDDLFKKYGM